MKPSINAYMSVHDQPDRPMWAATAPKGRSVIAVGVLASQAAVSLKNTSGFVIVHTGFEDFFIGTSLIGIPVALLAWFVWRNHPPQREGDHF